jgi:hypothetical protein
LEALQHLSSSFRTEIAERPRPSMLLLVFHFFVPSALRVKEGPVIDRDGRKRCEVTAAKELEPM